LIASLIIKVQLVNYEVGEQRILVD